jgi:hypothetical protein
MSAYYKCEIDKDGYKEDAETTEPAKLPYYAYVVLIFLSILFFVIFIMSLIKYLDVDILFFLNNRFRNLNLIYPAILCVSAIILIIFSIIKVTIKTKNIFSPIIDFVVLLPFVSLIIFSIVKIMYQ